MSRTVRKMPDSRYKFCHPLFAMTSSLGAEFNLKIEKNFKNITFFKACHKSKKCAMIKHLLYHVNLFKK